MVYSCSNLTINSSPRGQATASSFNALPKWTEPEYGLSLSLWSEIEVVPGLWWEQTNNMCWINTATQVIRRRRRRDNKRSQEDLELNFPLPSVRFGSIQLPLQAVQIGLKAKRWNDDDDRSGNIFVRGWNFPPSDRPNVILRSEAIHPTICPVSLAHLHGTLKNTEEQLALCSSSKASGEG